MSRQDIPVLDRIRNEVVQAVARSAVHGERPPRRRLLVALAGAGAVAAAAVAVIVFALPTRSPTQ
ncbi:MAG TPA: hypothetical protein VEM93_07905, partial [Actinomycetota bacterium]|nr:hypothetical protein [Actinomycetota bacterium]